MEDKKLDKPSEMFEDIVQNGGSLTAECDGCGRTYFATGKAGADYEDDELMGLREDSKKKPDRFIEWANCDFIPRGEIDGKTLVIGCECNVLSRYENWIWRHRYLIAQYLNKRSKEEFEEAQRQLKDVQVAQILMGQTPLEQVDAHLATVED